MDSNQPVLEVPCETELAVVDFIPVIVKENSRGTAIGSLDDFIQRGVVAVLGDRRAGFGADNRLSIADTVQRPIAVKLRGGSDVRPFEVNQAVVGQSRDPLPRPNFLSTGGDRKEKIIFS